MPSYHTHHSVKCFINGHMMVLSAPKTKLFFCGKRKIMGEVNVSNFDIFTLQLARGVTKVQCSGHVPFAEEGHRIRVKPLEIVK